jgi:hypothetical protein
VEPPKTESVEPVDPPKTESVEPVEPPKTESVESVEEPPKTESVESTEQPILNTSTSIIEVLENTIFSFIEHNTTQLIPLNEKEILFIQKMMKNSPTTFKDMTTQINEILQNKEIELQDIPKIIHIISTIYIRDFTPNKINLISCIRFTIDALLESGLIPLPNIEIYIIKSVIDTSLDLLQTSLPVVKNKYKKIYKYLCKCIDGCTNAKNVTIK